MGSLDRIHDQVRRLAGEHAQSAFLPRGHEGAHRTVVGDGGASGGEREPTARAFEAAADGPGGGRSAARAARTVQGDKSGPTSAAERGPESGTADAAAGNKQVEQHIRSTVRGKDARVGAESAPKA